MWTIKQWIENSWFNVWLLHSLFEKEEKKNYSILDRFKFVHYPSALWCKTNKRKINEEKIKATRGTVPLYGAKCRESTSIGVVSGQWSLGLTDCGSALSRHSFDSCEFDCAFENCREKTHVWYTRDIRKIYYWLWKPFAISTVFRTIQFFCESFWLNNERNKTKTGIYYKKCLLIAVALNFLGFKQLFFFLYRR